jgi:ParB-like nuclease domain
MIQVKIKDIKPAKYNPRKIDEASFNGLCNSIRKFGMPQPLVVNKRSGVLVAGHQRLKAAETIGWTEVPVVYVDLTNEQEKALNITLNNKHIAGEYNEGVSELLREIEQSLGEDFMKELRLDLIEVPTITFDEPEEKKEPKEKESDLIECPNCGCMVDKNG